jgi:hypothetical protein
VGLAGASYGAFQLNIASNNAMCVSYDKMLQDDVLQSNNSIDELILLDIILTVRRLKAQASSTAGSMVSNSG